MNPADINVLQRVQGVIIEMLQAKSDVFLHEGLVLLRFFMILVFMLYGIKCAFSHDMDFAGLINKILLFGVPILMLQSWKTPAPVLGDSTFPDLITKQTLYLANHIGQEDFENVTKKLKDYALNHPWDITGGTSGFITSLVIWLAVMGLQWVLMFVMSWGYIAQAVLVLLGPIFIPFLVFEPLSFLFWGWFKSFLQYSFYPVVAACVTHVIGQLALGLLDQIGGIAIVPILLVCITAALSTTSLVSHIFSGSAGGGGGLGGALGSVAGRVVPGLGK